MTFSAAEMPWSGETGMPMLGFMPDADLRTWRKQLGRALQTARKAEGMTQEDVADHLGVDAQTLSRWETGVNSMKAFDLVRLADHIRMPPGWIIKPPDSIAVLARYEERRKLEREIGVSGTGEPSSVLDLLHQARMSGVEEGLRRAREDPDAEGPEPHPPSPARQPRGSGAGSR